MIDYSIKSPTTEVWKPGYTEAQVRMLSEGGLVNDDWLVCPTDDFRQPVKMATFMASPSVDAGAEESKSELLISVTKDVPMTVAALSWL